MLRIEETEPAWYCFTALPKKEHIAAQYIAKDAGLETFCPRIAYDKITRRGKVRFIEPLFPGYLFVNTDLKECYRHLLATPGIRNVVSFGGNVPTVPAAFVDEMRQRWGENNIRAVQAPVIRPGQTVTITDGPFKQLQAVVNGELDRRARVRVLLDFLGRQIELQIEYDRLLVNDGNPKAKVWLD